MTIESETRIMEIKDLIKTKRLEKGFTMKELALLVNVSEATVSRWESGEIANMKRSNIVALAKHLEISPEFFLSESFPSHKENVKISNPQSNIDIDTLIAQKYGDDCMNAILLYAKLDTNDRAELRGEMKQMLKADKYHVKNESKHA